MVGRPELFHKSTADVLKALMERPKTLYFTTSLQAYTVKNLQVYSKFSEYFVVTKFPYKVLDITDSVRGYNALALQQDSEFIEFFNYYITKMRESGLIHALRYTCCFNTTVRLFCWVGHSQTFCEWSVMT